MIKKFKAGDTLPSILYDKKGLIPTFGTDTIVEITDASIIISRASADDVNTSLVTVTGPGDCFLRDGLVFNCTDAGLAIEAKNKANLSARYAVIMVPLNYPDVHIPNGCYYDETGFNIKGNG